jgi:hypothetical protein
VGTELFHADRQMERQTGLTRLMLAFRSCFSKKWKNYYVFSKLILIPWSILAALHTSTWRRHQYIQKNINTSEGGTENKFVGINVQQPVVVVNRNATYAAAFINLNICI